MSDHQLSNTIEPNSLFRHK